MCAQVVPGPEMVGHVLPMLLHVIAQMRMPTLSCRLLCCRSCLRVWRPLRYSEPAEPAFVPAALAFQAHMLPGTFVERSCSCCKRHLTHPFPKSLVLQIGARGTDEWGAMYASSLRRSSVGTQKLRVKQGETGQLLPDLPARTC